MSTAALEELLTGPGPLCCGCSHLLTETEVDACEPGCDEYCAACRAQKGTLVTTADAWKKGADHYAKLAAERADEGTSVQLACLVLADYCVHQWSGDWSGPTLEMVALAENTVGDRLDEVVAALMKDAAP